MGFVVIPVTSPSTFSLVAALETVYIVSEIDKLVGSSAARATFK